MAVVADQIEYWPNSDTEVTFGALQFAVGLFAGPLLVRGLAARVSVLSLAHLAGARSDALPAAPYLAVPATRRDAWRARVEGSCE